MHVICRLNSIGKLEQTENVVRQKHGDFTYALGFDLSIKVLYAIAKVMGTIVLFSFYSLCSCPKDDILALSRGSTETSGWRQPRARVSRRDSWFRARPGPRWNHPPVNIWWWEGWFTRQGEGQYILNQCCSKSTQYGTGVDIITVTGP